MLDCNRYASLLVITLLIALVARPCHAEIACYTNGESTNVLTQEFGTYGLGQCTSPTSKCYESVGETTAGVPIQHALYRSGCTPCAESRSFKYDCQVCDTPLCNNKRALKIQFNNIACYVGTRKLGSVFGNRTIFCTDGVEHCFYAEYMDHSTQKKLYQAGCGMGAPGCWNCKLCKGSLCNVPDELKGQVKTPQILAKKPTTRGSDVKDGNSRSGEDDADSTDVGEKSNRGGKKFARKNAVKANTPDAEAGKSTDLDSSGSEPAIGAAVPVSVAALIVTSWVLPVVEHLGALR